MIDIFKEKVKVVELTFKDGTKKLCRGGRMQYSGHGVNIQ